MPFPSGEQGTLREVQYQPANHRSPANLTLVVEYEGRRFVGLLFLDDPAILMSLYQNLQGWIGLDLHEIGDKELDV